MDRVLLTADRNNIEACIALAQEHTLGIEVMTFAYPDILDGEWEREVQKYKRMLRAVPGMITMHGPFIDMVSGSPDPRINQVCFQRYKHAIHIASELGAEIVVLHANFIGSLHNDTYRQGWHQRNLTFWNGVAETAREAGVTIALENMWEFDPSIIADVLREINHPNLMACLDVGHSFVFSDSGYSLQDWLRTLRPWLIHTHLNNNNGIIDEHYGLDWEKGVLNYNEILPLLRGLPHPPNMVLEMYHVQDMRNSLYYFQLGETEMS